MTTIQTHAAPDLLTVGRVDTDENNSVEYAARIGLKAVPVHKVGKRASDTLSEISISLEDLKALCKEAYKLGWGAKCIHVRQLMGGLDKEIGT